MALYNREDEPTAHVPEVARMKDLLAREPVIDNNQFMKQIPFYVTIQLYG